MTVSNTEKADSMSQPDIAVGAVTERTPVTRGHGGPNWALAMVTALGIVYGDIGTSPLYSLQVALAATGHAKGLSGMGSE